MKDRNYAIDFLRLVAILAVILIHTTNRTFELGYYNLSVLPLTFLLNSFSRFAVGVFFIISGYLLALRYNPSIPLLSFYKRRVFKLILPYIFWSVFYYEFFYHYPLLHLFSWDFLKDLLTGDASYQLYFIPTIIVLYLIFPFFMKYKKFFFSFGFIIILFFFQYLLLTYLYYSNHDLPVFPTLRNALINVFPFLIGAAAAIHPSILTYAKKYKMAIFAIAVFSLIVMMRETWITFYDTLNPNFVRSQWRITTPIYAFSMALILAFFYQRFLTRYNKQVFFLSGLSMGVFFCHVVFISVFWRFFGSYLYSKTAGHVVETLWLDPVVFLFVATSSFIFTFLLNKIPVIRNIVGATLK